MSGKPFVGKVLYILGVLDFATEQLILLFQYSKLNFMGNEIAYSFCVILINYQSVWKFHKLTDKLLLL